LLVQIESFAMVLAQILPIHGLSIPVAAVSSATAEQSFEAVEERPCSSPLSLSNDGRVVIITAALNGIADVISKAQLNRGESNGEKVLSD
jgi:hypothetical protein